MIQRIKSIKPLPDFVLSVVFDDGHHVHYDVKEDFSLPGYDVLRTEPGLFDHFQLDPSRTCVSWSEDVDLPSDTLYEFGQAVSEEDCFSQALYEQYQQDPDKGKGVSIEDAAAQLGTNINDT